MADRPDSRDWLLDRMITVASENETKTVWLVGAFFILSFVSISINLGSIETAELDLLFFKSTITDTWPIRLMVVVSATMVALMILYFALEAQKLISAIGYLTERDHDRAQELANYGLALIQSSGKLVKNQALLVLGLLVLALIILILVWASFAISLFL